MLAYVKSVQDVGTDNVDLDTFTRDQVRLHPYSGSFIQGVFNDKEGVKISILRGCRPHTPPFIDGVRPV